MGKIRKNLVWGGLALIFVASVYLIIVLGFWFAYQDRIYPGIKVAGLSVSGMNQDELSALVSSEMSKYLLANEYLIIGEEKIQTHNLDIKVNPEKTYQEAKNQVKNPFYLGITQDLPIVITIDEAKLFEIYKAIDDKERKAVVGPSISVEGEDLIVKDGANGARFVYGDNLAKLKKEIGQLNTNIPTEFVQIEPASSAREMEEVVPEIRRVVEEGLVLTSAGEMKVPPAEIVSWIQLGTDDSMAVSYFGNFQKNEGFGIFSKIAIENYLKGLSKNIDTSPVNATLTIRDGKVAVFSLSKDGKSLNASKSAENITTALATNTGSAKLEIETIKPEITTDSIDNLGITELVATGYSNFAGSPANRRHNIRVGASKFNGLLVKPDETFSFTANLGEVDAANGYLPELVIKQNTTTPEYGGGLCQVSSTAFRAALNAGLPIVARKAHSYPVSYYKPYGTDATIYIPNPDIKFKNDTGAHILIQTRIVGNLLYFDFYGTNKDISVKFAGNKAASGAVDLAEKVTPYTYDHGGRGPGSFKAIIYRFTYDANNKLIKTEDYFSNYDSPDKYPR